MPITYDDSNLQRLIAEMEPKRRLQALKGGFRRVANQVRKTAVNNLRSSGITMSKGLDKGIRALVFKRKAGFRVTIGTRNKGKNGKGEAGFHTTRRGIKKPILLWAEGGTEERETKPKKGSRRRAARLREQHRTGRMKRYGFMEQTLNSVKSTVTADMQTQVVDNIKRISDKYGCK